MSSSTVGYHRRDGWPEEFGFSIYGKGPSYIIKVLSDGVAAGSGLKPGDQILQVDSHDVSGWTAEDIKTLVSKLSNLPPSLGVVSRLKEISLTPSTSSHEFGFSLIGTFPVKIHQVKPGSPSESAGLKRDDVVVKIDGDAITSLVQARRLADNAVRNGGIKMGIIPAPTTLPNTFVRDMPPRTSRVREFVKKFEAPRAGKIKAQAFIEKIKESLADRPAVVEGIVRSIKQYAEDRNIEAFVFTLSAILDPPEERKILEELRMFIPRQHKLRYDALVKKSLKLKNAEIKNSRLKNFSRDSPLPPIGYRHALVQHDGETRCFVATIRLTRVVRRGMSFGITLRGESPVQVQSVDPGSPAERAGLQQGDEILSLNGLDITNVPHERAIALLQGSGSMPTLVVQTTSGALAPSGSSLHKMACRASPAIDPQIFNTLENMSMTSGTSAEPMSIERDQNNNNNNKNTVGAGKLSPVKVTRLNATWTQRYVSPEFQIHGENFDQHLFRLLMPSERRKLRQAIEEYEKKKDMDHLLELVNSVLDNPNKWPVWYFIVQSMKGQERSVCRRKLAELLTSQTSIEPGDVTKSKSDPEDGAAQLSKTDRNESGAAAKGRIRRRRTMRAAYNRSNETDSQDAVSRQDDTGTNPPLVVNRESSHDSDDRIFRGRRTRRRCTVAGEDIAKEYDIEQPVDNFLHIDEPKDKQTHIPATVETMGERGDRQDPNELQIIEDQTRITTAGVRRRRRDPQLRRLQSADTVDTKEISMARDALLSRNSLPSATLDEVPPRRPVGRGRRRRSFRKSLDLAVGLTKAPLGSHERAALVVRRRAENAVSTSADEIPRTNIDDVTENDSPQRKETAYRRRRSATSVSVSRIRDTVPETSIDDVLISTGNDNNNNINNFTSDWEEDSCDPTTDEQYDSESNMSLKSPLSMSRLRSSFRISSKSKNKELSLPKEAEANASPSDEKVKNKKSGGRGLLGRMGMGKKHPSGSESSSKEDSKSKKLFGRGKSANKKEAAKQAETTPKPSTASPVKEAPKSPDPIPSPQSVMSSPLSEPESLFVTDMEINHSDGYDDEKKKGYMSNLKKRLTFSRPPRNPDTAAFLTELSAQFDEQCNILDDLASALEQTQTAPNKYGSKWSYLPNGSMPDAPGGESQVKDDLSDLGLSDIENNAPDVTPPFPLMLDSGDESGVGTMGTMSTPSPTQPHHGYRDRELEWERERLNRRRRRKQAFESLTSQHSDEEADKAPTPAQAQSQPQVYSPTANAYQDDEMIYDVPKTAKRTRSNRRSRREAMASRSVSVPNEVSYPPNTRHTRRRRGPHESETNTDQNYVDMVRTTHIDRVSMNGSPTEQTNFFDRAKEKGYRVSGVVGDIRTVFSEAEESLHHDVIDSMTSSNERSEGEHGSTVADGPGFAGEAGRSRGVRSRRRQQTVTHLPTENYVYVDDDVVYAEPRSPGCTAVRLRRRNRSSEQSQGDVVDGDLSFTDINSLLQAYDDEDEQPPEVPPLPDCETPPPIPPPPPMIPMPPPIPPPPPIPNFGDSTTSPARMNVKRINWQKIEPPDLKETVWGQIGEDFDTINDVVKYLDLEQHFATKKAKELRRLSLPVKRDAVSILSHKKAYNISILLAHLKMTVNELRSVLLSGNDNRLDASQYKQMLMYAPDDDEATKLLVYRGELAKLNEADQYAKKMVTIPGFRLRLQALLFKKSFVDREEDVRVNLEHLQQASMQLRKSKKLAKILEFVLAMGNYMNRGHNRISKATGFKIQFLADMDSTKTSDNKLTFLHILARAVSSKFPDLCHFSEDLRDVRPASRVAYPAVFQELQEMRTEWVEIRDRMPEALTNSVRGDRFKQVMGDCLVQTNAALKRLEMLLASTLKEFSKVTRYFGESGKSVGMQHFFNIFGEFIVKFEKADREIKFITKNKSTNMEET